MAVFADKIAQVMLQKNQIYNVFQQLRCRVGLEFFLAQHCLQPADYFVVIAGLAHDFAGDFAVKLIQRDAPAFVTVHIHRVAVTRNFPAANMLTTHGQLHQLRGAGREMLEHRGHALRVEQLLGISLTLEHFPVGIFGIGGIKFCNRLFKAHRVRNHVVHD